MEVLHRTSKFGLEYKRRLACPSKRLPFRPNGGGPKGGGWIRLKEAESAAQMICLMSSPIHTAAKPRNLNSQLSNLKSVLPHNLSFLYDTPTVSRFIMKVNPLKEVNL